MYSKTGRVKLIFVTCFLVWVVGCQPKGNAPASESATPKVSTENTTDQVYSAAIEKDPSNPEPYYNRSKYYFSEKFLDRALADIQDALLRDSLNPLYHYHKARVSYAMNKTMDAEKSYLKAIQLKPDYEEAMMKLAELYYVVKEHRKSVDLLNTVVAINKQQGDAYFFRGMNQKEIGDTVRSIQSFQKALDVDAAHYDAAMQLGILFTETSNRIALEYINTAIRIQPRSAEAYFARAYFHQRNRNWKEALMDYKKVLSLDADRIDAYYNTGIIHFATGKYDDALQVLDYCIRMNPEYIDAYFMRGVVNEKKGNRADALLNYQYTLQLDPNYTPARVALKKLGK